MKFPMTELYVVSLFFYIRKPVRNVKIQNLTSYHTNQSFFRSVTMLNCKILNKFEASK
jgi:hypothetical protein